MKPQNHTLPARLLALSLLALPVAAPGAVTDLSDTPLSGASSMAIKPNILFILDDSYSMDWTYLPDWAGEIIYNPGTSSEKKWRPSSYQSYNANFNGVAYNPAVRYLPPSYFDAQDHLDAVAYPSQTSAATTGWTQVPLDGYGIQSKARVDLVGNAFYYRTVPGEYCKDRTLRDCGNQNGPSVDFPVPATLRWCQTEGDAKKANSDEPACQAVFIDDSGAKGGGSLTYMYPRMPAPRTTRISFSGSGQTTVGSVKVNGGEILSGSATASTPSALASEIAKKIHACATAKAGNCALAGYDAEVLSTSPYGLHMVVIYAPGDTSAQPSVTIDSGVITATPYPFAAPDPNIPGHVELIPITATVNSYPKAASRTDCDSETHCTYAEEMTNYANWHAYYRTRMQAMKTAASRSFEPILDKYRIGYLSINNNTGTDFQNVADFGGAHKKDWYDKLFAARLTEGADTPLRKALSDAGWLFAGKYNGKTLNGITVVDPMQYYCQPNVAILSTDGYWNKAAGLKLNGGAIGDQDGPASGEDRPILDGGAGLRHKVTEKWTKRYEPQAYTWLQKQVEQWKVNVAGFQMSTRSKNTFDLGHLQESRHQWRTDTWKLMKSVYAKHWWVNANQVTKWKTTTSYLRKYNYQLQQQTLQLEKRTNTDITYQQGQLQKLPKQLYRKTERDLYMNIKQVYQKDKQGTGWSERYPVSSCTENANTICEFDSTNDTWIAVPSCIVSGRGKVNPSSTQGDNRFTIYETQVSCRYQYSPTVVTAPTPTTTVESCVSQGSAGSPYTVSKEVKCEPVSGAANNAKNVEECEVTADYTCRFVWESTKLWKESYGCVSNPGGGNTIGSEWTNPGRMCYAGQYTSYTPVSECKAGTVNGVTTQCRDNPVVVGGQTDSSGWKAVDTCQETSSYDAKGQKVKCQEKYLGYNNNVSSCTPTSTGKDRYKCEWYGTTAEKEVTTCTSQGGEGNSSWTGPRVTCMPVASVATCQQVDGVWYYIDPNTQQVDKTRKCEYEWEGWSGFYAADSSGCTPVGTGRNPSKIGDTRCQYEAGQGNGKYSGTQCTNPTTSSLPSGWSNYNTFKDGDKLLLEYKACYDTWTTPQGVNSCVNDGTFSKCSYAYDGPKDGICPSGTQGESSGSGTWTVKNPCKSDKGFEVKGWVEHCTADSTTTCTPTTAYSLPIIDPSFSALNPPPNDATHLYQTIVDSYFHAYYDGLDIRNVPQVTKEGVLPNNLDPAWCDVDVDPNDLTKKPNTKVTPGPASIVKLADGSTVQVNDVKITCQAEIPKPSDPIPVETCLEEEPTKGNTWLKTTCSLSKTGPTIDKDCGRQSDGSLVNDIPASESNDWTHTICIPGSGDPTPDTLADVAEYYFKTDLRTSDLGNCAGAPVASGGITLTYDVCSNAQGNQVMSTYTLGLGASGVMRFQSDYKTATSGDFFSVWKGVEAKPNEGVCAWQTAGTECNWPRPSNNSQTNIDDLWHAAVNGRGTYFSAENPSAMAAGISAALQDVTVKEGSLAGVSTTGPRLDTDSAIFQTSFSAGTWMGDVHKYAIDKTTGRRNESPVWSAKALLDGKAHTGRIIHTFDTDGPDNLKPFVWDELSAARKAFFKKPHIAELSQLCATGTICLPSALQNDVDFGANLVNFLRGDRSNEGSASEPSKPFRERAGLLGDIVSSEAAYAQQAPRGYTDNGYREFKEKTEHRAGMLYVGANDGMLHAFDAVSGQEVWAFVPSFVLPDLYRLADKNYMTLHHFFVDGTPVTGDICVDNCAAGKADPVWKTLLVGGLNRGGRGYYALDVTDPAHPKGLWEFKDANLGYSYGNPVITKLANGTWVVLVTSGYNNVLPGDGQGHLFVLDAKSGALIRDISTGEGSSADPSGLAKIAVWGTFLEYNNTALRVYGGDLSGNLWRFDINGDIGASGYEAQRLATLKDTKGRPQPITSRPELGIIENQAVVFVGTGQLLGASDTGTDGIQSLYAIKDRLADADYGNPRDLSALFVEQTMSSVNCPADNPHCVEGSPIVTVTKRDVDWASKNGWYVDFPVGGERVTVDMHLEQGTLVIITNTPQTGACVPAGISFEYQLDYRTGGYVLEGTDGLAGIQLGDNLGTTGLLVQADDGSIINVVGQDCTGEGCVKENEVKIDPPEHKVRRISWRELE